MLIVNMGRSVLSYRARVLGLVLCGLLCLACVYAGDGREYKFRTMSPSGGLGYDGVKSIIQDRNGFIWIVTADELFHFDGFNYKRYSKRMAVRNEFFRIRSGVCIWRRPKACFCIMRTRICSRGCMGVQ